MAHPAQFHATTPSTDGSVSTRPTDDPFAWWEDKQVAVMVNGDLVRGWVLTCRRAAYAATGPNVGQMTIVLLICDPVVRAAYPETVVMDVLDDGAHGHPRNVRGQWAEHDLADVHTSRRVTYASKEPASASQRERLRG